jgi:uncharacterized protein with HEPN domain
MPTRIAMWLEDMERAVDEIALFFPEGSGPGVLAANLMLRRAVERNLEILGEAMNRILRERPDFPIEHARRIVDTRNRIAHGYDAVSEDVLWTIIVRYLPALREEVRSLRDRYPNA